MLSLAIDISRMLDSATFATELKGGLQHHAQHFPSDFHPTSVGFPSDYPASSAFEVLPTSLLMSLFA
ncbi:unnamed protein product [Sphagnum jensenii]|uniref:Uncharacterized protein n=1 Tax=Sphagnum jensenii TaxID=128206 RepID=A0ABP1BJU6_9BRYO